MLCKLYLNCRSVGKPHITISIVAKEVFSKISHPFMIKTHNKPRIKGNFLSVDKECLQSPKLTSYLKVNVSRTALMVPWLRTWLQMQGTWVWPSVLEDLTSWRAVKPACHSYGIPCLEPMLSNKRSHTMSIGTKESPLLQPEKAHTQQQRPSPAKKKSECSVPKIKK